jgi:hypothetical protein
LELFPAEAGALEGRARHFLSLARLGRLDLIC